MPDLTDAGHEHSFDRYLGAPCQCGKTSAKYIHELREQNAALKHPLERETYACDRCGVANGLDTSLPREQWEAIAGDEWGVLCTWCIDKIAAEKGVQYEAWLYFVGDSGHSRLYDSDADDYRWVQLYQQAQRENAALEAEITRLRGMDALARAALREKYQAVDAPPFPEPMRTRGYWLERYNLAEAQNTALAADNRRLVLEYNAKVAAGLKAADRYDRYEEELEALVTALESISIGDIEPHRMVREAVEALARVRGAE